MSAWAEITNAIAQEFTDVPDLATATRILVRLAIATALGGAIGFEREFSGKSAGLRTHMLVALGSCLFVLAPLEGGATNDGVSRVIQGLLAGIGFLGAGAIVKSHSGDEVHGLTTAATIWMTAAIGMAVALGQEVGCLMAAALALIILRLIPGGGHNGHDLRRPPDREKQ